MWPELAVSAANQVAEPPWLSTSVTQLELRARVTLVQRRFPLYHLVQQPRAGPKNSTWPPLLEIGPG